ncbi:putative sulfoacetate transporter SauU [Pandoraea communis]|uniref:Putative sulfoacetate transporter SauU n=1 Tax=Pandoraea communis TaxID=2508297 RepID=A0A5E4X1U5_9BURK|nr:MFS transporter [Pandoraea communis]VVE30244.1 putative sulfoacetate transporter SauU [Pandoraea communis]
MSKALRIFVLFACGYFVSYVYRGVNIGFAPFMTRELGLSPADLGLLTSLYFLGFAGAQLPAGVLLDKFGPRRVASLVLLLAAAGAALFGLAHGVGALMVGRLLIGVGVSVCLGSAFKALAQWFPVARLPLLNGLVMAVGGMGGVVVGTPLNWLLGLTDWRIVSFGLSALTVFMSVALWFGAPEKPGSHAQGGLFEALKGVRQVLGSGMFWKVTSLSGITQGVFYAMQSLWMAPFMRDVEGLSEVQVASLVSVVGLAMMGGSVVFGAAARWLERRGVSVFAFSGVGMVLFVVVQSLLMMRAPIPPVWLWAAYGIFGGSGILSYAVLAEHFHGTLIGRVNTSLTLVIFLLIFFCQVGVGAMLGAYAAHSTQAHFSAWTVLIVLQVLGAVWYFWPQRQRVGKVAAAA